MVSANIEMKKASKQGEAKIDEELYSRQLYVLGHDAMKEMMKKRILVIGMDGLGQEIAKNICLAGVKKVNLHDKCVVEGNDLENGFYIDKESMGKRRDEAVVEKIKGLNNYVSVGVVDEMKLEEYEIVVSVNQDFKRNLELDDECREKGVKFIMADVQGAFSRVFCDLGEHDVVDRYGEIEKRGSISYIDENGIVTMVEGGEHGLEDGEMVAVEEKVYRVEIISRLQLRLLGYEAKEIRKGIDFEKVKETMKMEFRSLRECIEKERREDILCFEEEERTMRVHRLFCKMDKGGDGETAKEVEEIFKRGKGVLVPPMCSVMGGFAAQEVIKAASGKFIPLKQFYYFDIYDMVVRGEERGEERYAGMVKLFGKEAFDAISKMKVFLVGSGAIGCENIKNFVMSGIGKEGKIHITDMDMIEKSNLNRQFLFREKDVGKSKSETAAREAVKMNGSYRNAIKWYESAVGQESEGIFNDMFMRELDIVANALDNVDARNYMDERCVLLRLPMFDAGTSGTKGHMQCVIPYLTESYRSTRDPATNDVPLCTIRLFPSTFDHTISWAVEMFKKLFELDVAKINEYLERNRVTITAGLKKELQQSHAGRGPKKSDDLGGNGEIDEEEMLADENENESVTDLIMDAPITVELCIKKAISLFVHLFSTTIQRFLSAFPPDAVRNGVPFWTPPKRIFVPLSFNINEKLHILFVETCANLYAASFKIRSISRNEVFLYLENMLNLCEPNPITFGNKPVEIKACESIKYDKDSWHVDFVYAAATIRAKNFKIKEQSRLYVKGISGNIVPAIATTTAIVSGLTTLEVIRHARIKGLLTPLSTAEFSGVHEVLSFEAVTESHASYLQYLEEYGKAPLSYKNTFLDLSMPFLSRVDTVPPKITLHLKVYK